MINGRGPSPALLLLLIERLPDDSLTAALAAGDRKLFGWGVERHLLADIFDSIGLNTKATGNWKKGKSPNIPAWPRPEAKKVAQKSSNTSNDRPRVTVADLYAKFQRR